MTVNHNIISENLRIVIKSAGNNKYMGITLYLFFIFILMLPNPAGAFVTLNADHNRPRDTSPDVSLTERLRSHVEFLASDSLEGRGLGTRGKILAKNYIASQFKEIGIAPAGEDYFHHFQARISNAWVPATNVVGYIEGSSEDLRSEYILIGAHYDHLGYEYRNGQKVIYPGADDNASGTAALIEMARFLAQNTGQIGRSIIFVAFDAEESGLIGARKFIEESDLFDVGNIRAMFSLDMVGMYSAYSGLDLTGIGAIDNGAQLAERVADEHGINLKNTSAETPFATDTQPFGRRGIPAAHAFTGTESPYHKPGDTYDLLDYEGMSLVTGFLLELVAELSSQPEINPSRRFLALQKPRALRFHKGILLNTGGNHHRYDDEFYRANNVFSFGTGIFLQIHVGETFTFQPEIIYEYYGSRSAAGNIRIQSLTLPLNLQLNLLQGTYGMVRFYPFAGGYMRFNLSGEVAGNSPGFNYPDSEWGANLGIGGDYMKVHFGYTWRRGLTKFFPDTDSGVYNSGHFFTIGYRF
jgi:aminopeptidase YwaD